MPVADVQCTEEQALDSLKSAAAELTGLGASAGAPEFVDLVKSALDRTCRAIEACEDAGLEKREILSHLGSARAVHAESPFIGRAQAWPRGYAGDFETVEYLCEAVNRAPAGTLGHALEELALNSPITAQHRNKVHFQANRILAACERIPAGARVLSIGCGGCRDIRFIADQLHHRDVQFVLCDFDYDALDFALHALGPLGERCTYLNATIPRVLKRLDAYGPFDLVIAGGVFDYLPDRWVTLSMRNIWSSLLAPDGEVIFTNVVRGNPYRVWLEYLANWELIERDEDDIRRCCLAAGMPMPALNIERDATGLAMLVSATLGR
jgi:extracellular factor (EF) 3-hydroxypalmitic acid methyl ester biosynthesis protein